MTLPMHAQYRLSRRGRFAYPGRVEYFFACPYCWEQISMLLDTSVKGQIYVEDCEVCCQPIEVRYTVEDGAVCDFEARAVQ
jgi:transcription elongation factor Elf1